MSHIGSEASSSQCQTNCRNPSTSCYSCDLQVSLPHLFLQYCCQWWGCITLRVLKQAETCSCKSLIWVWALNGPAKRLHYSPRRELRRKIQGQKALLGTDGSLHASSLYKREFAVSKAKLSSKAFMLSWSGYTVYSHKWKEYWMVLGWHALETARMRMAASELLLWTSKRVVDWGRVFVAKMGKFSQTLYDRKQQASFRHQISGC